MQMTEEAFADYVNRQERDEFEVDIRNISCTLHQLVLAREETIVKLRQSADYLDSVWLRCRVSFIVLRFMYFVLGLVLELVISNLLLEFHLAHA